MQPRVRSRMLLMVLMLAGLAFAPADARSGIYATEVLRIQGIVEFQQVKDGKAVGAWRRVTAGDVIGPHFLLRTGARSFAHVNFHPEGVPMPRCVDGGSLIRVDQAASDPRIFVRVQVLRGRLTAIDGKRGKSLPVPLN